MMKVCPICGKNRVIFWPEHWVYRRGATYYCSEQCLEIDLFRDMKLMDEVKRKRRKGLIMEIQERNKKAVEIAMSGESPLPFLKTAGAKNPSATWVYIRKCALKENPTLEIPATFGNRKPEGNMTRMYTREKKEAEPPTLKLDGAIKIQTADGETVKVISKPEEPKATNKPGKPLQYDGYTVRCIEGQYGKFYWDYEYNRLDWTSPEGEEVSMSPKGWNTFCTEIMPKVMAILGV